MHCVGDKWLHLISCKNSINSHAHITNSKLPLEENKDSIKKHQWGMKVIAASDYPTNLLILRLDHFDMIDNQPPPTTNHKHQLIFLFGFFSYTWC